MSFDVDNSPPDWEHVGAADDSKSASPQPKGHFRSQSIKILRTRASAMSIRKQRETVVHTSPPTASEEAEFVVKDIVYDFRQERKEKKRGIWLLFGWKKC